MYSSKFFYANRIYFLEAVPTLVRATVLTHRDQDQNQDQDHRQGRGDTRRIEGKQECWFYPFEFEVCYLLSYAVFKF